MADETIEFRRSDFMLENDALAFTGLDRQVPPNHGGVSNLDALWHRNGVQPLTATDGDRYVPYRAAIRVKARGDAYNEWTAERIKKNPRGYTPPTSPRKPGRSHTIMVSAAITLAIVATVLAIVGIMP